MYAWSLLLHSANTNTTFSVFSGYDKQLLAYSQNTYKNDEHAETNLLFQQCLTVLKGRYYDKIGFGIIYWPKKNYVQNKFFINLLKNFSESRRLAESGSRFSITNISANSKPKAERFER